MFSYREDNVWLKCLEPRPSSKARVFCFPPAGGGANLFLSWPNDLPETVEAYGLQLPGRGERFLDPPEVDMSAIVNGVVAELEPLTDRPYVFFGHSLGALIAFDVARALRRRGARLPLHLIAGAYRAPDVLDTDPPLHQLPDEEFISELARLGGMPDEILKHKEMMELLLPMLRADFTLHETYVYTHEAPLPWTITACGGMLDKDVQRETLEGWRRQATGGFELRMYPGGHFFVKHEQRALVEIAVSALRAGQAHL
jgi:medium-chain acyl-[acyl-carrier-protein] hydrolase